jgi:tetratricopeptide (TPR) repeat protein
MDNRKILNAFLPGTVILFLLTWSPILYAQHDHMHDDHPMPENAEIGEVNFGVSCEEVQEDFDYALGMMHHMMYVASRNAFREIIENNPDCAMAYWGFATTLFQPLWGTRPEEDELQLGWQKIEKARELVKNERESYLVESTAAFFNDPESEDFWTRIENWVEGIGRAYEAYPDDPDIAALYGLSLLTKAQRIDDRDHLFDEAEEVLRGVFEKIPNHPGAIHYSIHATDIDGRAENALDMVEVYGEIAPEVPHALHMPSHIYVRLGDWSEVIDWNMASAEAAINHPAGDAESHHYIHAIDYLVYAYLQKGEDEIATSFYEDVLAREKHQSSFVSAFHFAAIPARLAVEQKNWEEAADLEPRTPDYLPWDQSPWAEGLTWYARGLGAAGKGDPDSARESVQQLEKLRDKADESGDKAMAAYIEVDRLVLAGRISYLEGNEEEALELTRSAAELEKTVEKHPVTPGALLPPNEALGDLLMDLDRPAEAFEAYMVSNEIWPERYNTLLGAARASREAGDHQSAEELYLRLLEIANNSDRPHIREALSFVDE